MREKNKYKALWRTPDVQLFRKQTSPVQLFRQQVRYLTQEYQRLTGFQLFEHKLAHHLNRMFVFKGWEHHVAEQHAVEEG